MRFSLRLACVLSIVNLATSSSPNELVVGVNNLQAAAYHAASGDIILVAEPNPGSPKGVSVAVLPSGSALSKNFTTLPVLDDGSKVVAPMDVVMSGDTAYIVDQGNPGIVAFTRSSGEWKYSDAWRFSDLLPACDEQGRSFGLPESIVVTPQGEIFVTMAVMYQTRCLLKPFDRCCSKVSASTSVMLLDIPKDGGKVAFHDIFETKSFFKLDDGKDLGYHVRALDLTSSGDLVLAGYGDDMGYFAHSVWIWKKETKTAQIIAGQAIGQDGHTGDNGPATNATLNLPWGVAMMPSGDFYISEAGNEDIRVVKAGTISTFFGDWKKQPYNNQHPRKIHVGKPGALLFAVCGLGENEGRLLEFEVAPAEHTLIV